MASILVEIIKKLETAIRIVQAQIPTIPKLAIILGSGLGDFADQVENPQVIPTQTIPYYPRSTVEGHAGLWIFGQYHGKSILVLKGRIHFYEGYSFEEITFPIRLLAKLGINYLFVTNAAGSLNPNIRPGDLMLINDHINLFFRTPPFAGSLSPKYFEWFVHTSSPYDPTLKTLITQIASQHQIELKNGVLIGSTGPTYETAAEVRMMQILGGDAGTMSTIPEVIMANQLGLKVLAISCITNMTTGMSDEKIDHHKVTEIGAQIMPNFQILIGQTIVQLLNQTNTSQTEITENQHHGKRVPGKYLNNRRF